MIEHRTQALATVFLTGRNNVEVIPLQDLGDLSMICRILTDEDDSDMIFGVIHGGTSEPLSERSAERYLNSRFRALKAVKQYPFPVLILLFSMQSDDGFFCWRMEPDVSEGFPVLIRNDRMTCEKANRTSLDSIVERVRAWYAAYYNKIVRPG
jgi:hypothetical protein